jgi:hypothetical protein
MSVGKLVRPIGSPGQGLKPRKHEDEAAAIVDILQGRLGHANVSQSSPHERPVSVMRMISARSANVTRGKRRLRQEPRETCRPFRCLNGEEDPRRRDDVAEERGPHLRGAADQVPPRGWRAGRSHSQNSPPLP